MRTTVDLGSSNTRDAAGDHRVFLCDLRGLGVWIKFLTAGGNMYSQSSMCNLINFQSSGEWCRDFFGVSVGLMWQNTVGTAGSGCAWLEPVLDLHFHLYPRSERMGPPEAGGLLHCVETELLHSSSLLHTSGSVVGLMFSQ